MQNLTRRAFVGNAGGAVAGAAVAAAAGAACVGGAMAAEASAEAAAGAAGIEWADEADVVVLGTGAAGLSAAVTIGAEGLGSVIVLEAAPEEENGGNSRVCGQGVFCPDSVEGAVAYQTDLNGAYAVESELIQAWAEGVCGNIEWLSDTVGFDAVEMGTAEFPEAASADCVRWYAHEGGGPNQATWKLLMAAAEDCDTTIYYDARGVELVTNEAGEVIGVTTEDGRSFKAAKAVILACGGFEANQEMMNMCSPIGTWGIQPNGTWWNRGDGIVMCEKLGAQMWHMNNFSGNRASLQIVSPDDMTHLTQASFGAAHDFIILGPDGKRFVYEETLGQARHGKLFRAGSWRNATLPPQMFMLFNQQTYDAKNIFTSSSFASRTESVGALTSNDELLEAGIIVSCESAADIAAFTGLDEATVQASLDTWNAYADANDDREFHRGVESYDEGMVLSHTSTNTDGYVNSAVQASIAAFDLQRIELPCYCVKLFPAILNTQGGPKRAANGGVLRRDGSAIPRLFAAGEMGTVYSYKYNLGGNFSEAISSGRIAARSACALEAWE